MTARFRLWIVSCAVAVALTGMPVRAQNAAAQDVLACLRSVNNKPQPYDQADAMNALGAYRFSVNSLFNAGICQGRSPSYVSYDWDVCDFKGPPALYNRITSAGNILAQPALQDRLAQQLVIQQAETHKDMKLDDELRPLRRSQNASDLLGALLYRKGETALKLLTLAHIDSLDGNGYATSDYIKFFTDCAGGAPALTRTGGFVATSTAAAQTPAPTNAQSVPWRKLNDLPADLKAKMLLKVPELSLVLNPREQHAYALVTIGPETTQTLMVALTGSDFCNGTHCTYYLFRNGFADVIIFYAGQVLLAPGRNGLYVDGFYKPVEELNT